jgi:23S rRNA pseudouridine2605 synthase
MERLQKVIAHAGVASRRKAEELITSGQVKVNGELVTELGVKVGPADEIEVNGKVLTKEKHVYYVLNKPKGCITATFDDRGRSVVTDFLADVKERVYPVGRLDFNTTGVLILTNDGSLVNKLLRPEARLEKEYAARVEGKITKEMEKVLESGLDIGDHYTKPARVVSNRYNPNKNQSIVSIVITEGKYHQIKRMFEAVESKVLSLKRTRFGNLDVENIKLGDYRPLSLKEVNSLIKLGIKRK